MSRNVRIAPPEPEDDDLLPISVWSVILGGAGVAAGTFALIWCFAILGYALGAS